MSDNSRVKPLLLIGGATILVVVFTIWFFNNFEYKEVDKSTEYSKEARKNDFLAAEYYLKELGIKVESNGNRAKLLDTHDTNKTILLNNYGPKLSPTPFKKLKDWLNAGGHLIMKASDPAYTFFNIEIEQEDIKHNQLLEEFGIYASYIDYSTNEYEFDDDDDDYECEAEIDSEAEIEADVETETETVAEAEIEADVETETVAEAEAEFEIISDSEADTDEIVSSYVLNDGTEIAIEFSPSYYLFDPNQHASFTLENEYGIHLLQIKIGKGLLTVVSDINIFKNYAIENNDHAYLLSQLASVNTLKGGDLLLLYSTESDSIFTLLWRNAKQLCIAFFCMILIALWSMHNRLGPIIPQLSYNNRNIIEHLSAIARFSWRQDHGRYLLHKSRIVCEQFFIARYPALKSMSTQERIEHLSEVLDATPSKIHTALYAEPKSTHEYINSSHQLQKLWILK